MSSARKFPARRESVTEARRFARDVLANQSSEIRDAVELMVSELATNCIRHAHSDFEIMIETSQHAVRVQARDSGPGQPTPRSPTPSEPSGRGLRIVEAMSDAWGVVASPGGKTVWFDLGRQDANTGDRGEAASHGSQAGADTALRTSSRRPQCHGGTERPSSDPRACARARRRQPACVSLRLASGSRSFMRLVAAESRNP